MATPSEIVKQIPVQIPIKIEVYYTEQITTAPSIGAVVSSFSNQDDRSSLYN